MLATKRGKYDVKDLIAKIIKFKPNLKVICIEDGSVPQQIVAGEAIEVLKQHLALAFVDAVKEAASIISAPGR